MKFQFFSSKNLTGEKVYTTNKHLKKKENYLGNVKLGKVFNSSDGYIDLNTLLMRRAYCTSK